MKEIKVKVEEVPETAMYMTQHLGDGAIGTTKFDASFTLPNFSLIVSVGKKRYMVSQQQIISEVMRLHEQQ